MRDIRGPVGQTTVEVVVRDGERTHPAVRWAAREARRRGVELRIVIVGADAAAPPPQASAVARAL
ncbi:hypothetical protein, partial [Pseudonocardia lacus]|uniref:hypothetical protein n=1 Tax=Pseudonocardia lacus TaxID=2835865 RepID=UPI001BDD92E2